MIVYDFRCPIDDQPAEVEDVPLFCKGSHSVATGKHLHAEINQVFACPNGHQWRLDGALLLSREA